MAIAELATDGAVTHKRRKHVRFFFVGMAALAVGLLALAFIPEFVKFAQGTFPIPWLLHVHAVIMVSWVTAFVVQACLGATGRTSLHRRVGPYGVAIGWLAWASMVFVEFRALAVHPLPTDVRDYDWNLPGPYVYITFAIFLGWAVHERRRPAWHKRLMTFALFLSLLAAIQRYLWIPIDYGYLPFAALLDVALLGPLAVYDLYTLKGRLHPATIRGTAVFAAMQALLFALWGTELWRNFAATVGNAVHS